MGMVRARTLSPGWPARSTGIENTAISATAIAAESRPAAADCQHHRAGREDPDGPRGDPPVVADDELVPEPAEADEIAHQVLQPQAAATAGCARGEG